jgi:hypothetical protein
VNWNVSLPRRWTWKRASGACVQSKRRRISASIQPSIQACCSPASRWLTSVNASATSAVRCTSWSGSPKLVKSNEVRSIPWRATTSRAARSSAAGSSGARTCRLVT